MRGYYKCKQCNIVIDVLTTSSNPITRVAKVILPYCPQCMGKLQEIENSEYSYSVSKQWLRLRRKYIFKRLGERVVEMGVKFI